MSRINVYCDESGHPENDGQKVMVLGAITCPTSEVRRISDTLRTYRQEHGLSRAYEAKWTKVSKGQLDFYKRCIDLFFSERDMTFRGVLIPNKSALYHLRYDQSYDDFYYRMFYETLKFLIDKNNSYRIFLDIKDTRGGDKTRKLHQVLCKSMGDSNNSIIECVQQIRSHESTLLQLTDILIGAIGYKNKDMQTSEAKLSLVSYIEQQSGVRSLNTSSRLSDLKFNLFDWSPSGQQ